LIALCGLSASPLSLDEHVRAVTTPQYGAVATFLGVVRDHDPAVSGIVTHLEYSAHPDAGSVLARLAADLDEADVRIAVTHRTGLLAVGDAAIVAAVASAHRERAFDVVRLLVERVKAELPVWKKELLADGSHTWVGVS